MTAPRKKLGRPRGSFKLTREVARAIRIAYNLGRSPATLATRYDVHISTVYKVCRGETFTDVDPPRAKMRKAGAPKGGSPERRKLTTQQIAAMRQDYESGRHTYKTIAKKYKVALSTAYKWVQPDGYQPIRKERMKRDAS